MYEFLGIKLTWYKPDDDWRKNRLVEFVLNLYCRTHKKSKMGVINNIIKINDHKGELTIYWKNKPLTEERRNAEESWFDLIEYEIHHVYNHE